MSDFRGGGIKFQNTGFVPGDQSPLQQGVYSTQMALNQMNANSIAEKAVMKVLQSQTTTPTVSLTDGLKAVEKSTAAAGELQNTNYDGIYSGNAGINMSTGGVYTKPSGGISGLAGSRGTGRYGLQQGFSDQTMQFIAAARRAGYNISVGGGWRSYARQEQLRREKPTLAARPGHSNHGWGLAADLEFGSAAARRWAHDNAAKFGLRFPMSWESWHIEPAHIRVVSGGGKVMVAPTEYEKPKPAPVAVRPVVYTPVGNGTYVSSSRNGGRMLG